MRLSDFTSMISSWSDVQLYLCFIKYVKEMRKRGFEDKLRSVIEHFTDERECGNTDSTKSNHLHLELKQKIKGLPTSNDPFVVSVREAIVVVAVRSPRCGRLLDVFLGRERARISNKEFMSRFLYLADPSRATASTRVMSNRLLQEEGYDLYIYAETSDRGLGHTYKTEYWLGQRPR